MKYKAVLLDMDGTVLDTVEDIMNSANTALRKFGFPEMNSAQTKARLGNGSRVLITKALPEGTEPEILEKVLEFYIPYYDTHSHIKTRPYDGILELLENLKNSGYKLAIISNKPDSTVKELAGEFFPDMLETAVGESETVKRKPNPDAVIAAAEQMGFDISQCVYVGDSEVDIETAKRAGMDCISVSWGFRTKQQLVESGASRIADTVSELNEMINETI